MAKDWGLKKKTMAAELDLPKLQEVRTWHTRQVERVKVKEVEIPALKEKVEKVKVKEEVQKVNVKEVLEKVKVKEMVERLKVREVERLAQKGKVERVKVNESFIVKEEVMQTLIKSDVGLVEEMVQWLAADPKVQFVFISSSNHRQSHQQLITASVINLINRFAHSGLSLLNN